MTTSPGPESLPQGTLDLLILKTLARGPRHGYGVARWIEETTDDALRIEEGSLYPALQKLLLKGWLKASPTISETGRSVREYRLTPSGRRQLEIERTNFRRVTQAITDILETA